MTPLILILSAKGRAFEPAPRQAGPTIGSQRLFFEFSLRSVLSSFLTGPKLPRSYNLKLGESLLRGQRLPLSRLAIAKLSSRASLCVVNVAVAAT